MADRVPTHSAAALTAAPVRRARRAAHALLTAAAALALSACAVGPDYRRPVQDVGAAYAHAPEGRWIPADTPPRALPGDWWSLFGDAVLDDLMERMPPGKPGPGPGRGPVPGSPRRAGFVARRPVPDAGRVGVREPGGAGHVGGGQSRQHLQPVGHRQLGSRSVGPRAARRGSGPGRRTGQRRRR